MMSWTGGAQNSYPSIYFPHKNYLHKEIPKDCRKLHRHLLTVPLTSWLLQHMCKWQPRNIAHKWDGFLLWFENMTIHPIQLWAAIKQGRCLCLWDTRHNKSKTEKQFLSPEDPVYCWPHEALGKPKRKTHCQCSTDHLFSKDWPGKIALRKRKHATHETNTSMCMRVTTTVLWSWSYTLHRWSL